MVQMTGEAGTILILAKGDYDANVTYDILNLVNHNGLSWLAKKASTGIEPSDANAEYWHPFGTAVNIATKDAAGTVRPDGETITIDENGVISAVGGTAEKVTYENESVADVTNVKEALDVIFEGGIDVDVSALTTNLLNVTIPTTTKEGVTLTNNGDGSFVANGMSTNSSSDTVFSQEINMRLKGGQSYKFIGICAEGSASTFFHYLHINNSSYLQFTPSDEVIITPTNDVDSVTYYVICKYGVNIQNVVFKPMLTTNLEATLDDFVSYTGNTGKLNGDVAEIVKANPIWVDLVEGFNLNNALGKYRTPSGAIIKTLLNLPSSWTSGELSVEWIPFDSTNVYGMQILTYKSGSNLSIYRRAKNSSTWGDWQQYLHTGNKPSGTYTGNGSATERTIETGGIGRAILLTSNGGSAWVNNYGAVFLNGVSGEVKGLKYNELRWENGSLYSATTLLNSAGESVNYQVL